MPDAPVVKIEPAPAAVPASAASAAPVVAEPVVDPVVAAAPDPKPADLTPQVPATKKDWRDDRISELTAKLNAEKARKVEPPQKPNEPDADFEARVAARAEILADEKAQVREWNEKCSAVFTEGTTTFSDFKEKLGAVQGVVNGKDPEEVRQYNEVLATAIETGKAPQLLHQLGENPGEFKRLMGLPVAKRAMELATMAARLDAKPEPSDAPKPITPIGSKGAHHEEITPDDPNRGMKLSTREWMARREKQAVERGIQ